MKKYEAMIEEQPGPDSPWGDTCSECGEKLGLEFVYETDDNGNVTRAYHKTCERTE